MLLLAASLVMLLELRPVHGKGAFIHGWNHAIDMQFIDFGYQRMSDKEMDFAVSKYRIIAMEKCSGPGYSVRPAHRDGTEEVTWSQAIVLKRKDPTIRVMAYIHVEQHNFNCYTAFGVFMQHPEWWLRDDVGALINYTVGTQTWPLVDYSVEAARQWFITIPLNGTMYGNGTVDGVLLDGTKDRCSIPGNSPRCPAFVAGKLKMYEEMQALFDSAPNQPSVIGNGFWMYGSPYNEWLIPMKIDGIMAEHMLNFEQQDGSGKIKAHLVHKLFEMIANASAVGKTVTAAVWPGQYNTIAANGWPSYPAAYRATPSSPSLWRTELLAMHNRALSMFLTVASPSVWMQYMVWYNGFTQGAIECPAPSEAHKCAAPTAANWYPDLYKPLGPPEGPAVRNGNVYTRRFQHAVSYLNLDDMNLTNVTFLAVSEELSTTTVPTPGVTEAPTAVAPSSTGAPTTDLANATLEPTSGAPSTTDVANTTLVPITTAQPSTTTEPTSAAPATAQPSTFPPKTDPPPSLAPVTTFAPGTCTNALNCSSHATLATFNVSTGACDCVCAPPLFGGLTCNRCAAGFNQSTYPVCEPVANRSCAIGDCGAWAASVSGFTGNAGGCNCTCFGQAVNECRTCPARFDQSPPAKCSFCGAGFNSTSYPQCYRLCTAANCSFRVRTGGVTGDSNSGCRCSCVNQYSQPNCSVCPMEYDAQTQCATCAPAYYGVVPDCKIACRNDWNCSGHATRVTGQASVNCTCTCLGGWAGATCDLCPANYDLLSNCTSCAVGYAGPNCTDCTPATCNYRGTNVPTEEGCDCQCRNNFTDPTCSSCPEQLDPEQCVPGTCNSGLGYVLDQATGVCVSRCNVSTSCGGRAAQVFFVNATNSCNCTNCLHKWNGTNCSSCPLPFNGTQCNECIVGLVKYPQCIPLPNRTNVTLTDSLTVMPSQTVSGELTASPRVPRTKTPVETLTHPITASAPLTLSQPLTPSQGLTLTNSSSASLKPIVIRTKSSVSLSASVPDTTSLELSLSKDSASLTKSRSDSLCASNMSDCTSRSNHTEPSMPPVHCFCWCVNMWSEMFCNYCHPRFNLSADCGACSPGYVNYSTCDFAVYVSGNWTVAFNQTGMLPVLVRSTFFAALAADLTRFVVQTLNCSESKNTSAYIDEYFAGTSTVAFTVAILDPEPTTAYATASCVQSGLTNTFDSLLLENVSQLVEQLFPNDPSAHIFVGNLSINATVNASVAPSNLPCAGSVWCANAPPVVDPPPTVSYVWVAALAAGLLALVAVASVYLLWFRPRAHFRAKYAVNGDPDFRRTRDISDMEMEWCTSVQLQDPMAGELSGSKKSGRVADESPIGRRI